MSLWNVWITAEESVSSRLLSERGPPAEEQSSSLKQELLFIDGSVYRLQQLERSAFGQLVQFWKQSLMEPQRLFAIG